MVKDQKSKGRSDTHIVDDQLLLLVLSSQLADKHLDEVLEGGGHVHVLGLQLDFTAALLLHLLHQPGHTDDISAYKRSVLFFFFFFILSSLSAQQPDSSSHLAH